MTKRQQRDKTEITQAKLSEAERDFSATLTLLCEDIELLRDARTETEMASLCGHIETLKEEYQSCERLSEAVLRYERIGA